MSTPNYFENMTTDEIRTAYGDYMHLQNLGWSPEGQFRDIFAEAHRRYGDYAATLIKQQLHAAYEDKVLPPCLAADIPDSKECYLEELGVDNGELTLQLSGEPGKDFIMRLVKLFQDSGATNFLSVDVGNGSLTYNITITDKSTDASVVSDDKGTESKITQTIARLEDIRGRLSDLRDTAAISFAITEVGKQLPVPPVKERWEPNRCPTCDEDLGGDCNDGYYQNPYFDRCPECGQKLDYMM